MSIPPFEAGTPQGQAITTTLQSSYTDDLLSEYIARLESEFGVTINPDGAEPGHRRRPSTAITDLMQIEPQASVFAKRYARGEAQVVWTTLVADLETPVSAFLKIAGGRPMSFLLESVEGGAVRGRYSIIGLEPDLIWRADGANAEINRTARTQRRRIRALHRAAAAGVARAHCGKPDRAARSLPPMAAGIFGYLGYDMVRPMEELPQRRIPTRSAFPTRCWSARRSWWCSMR